MGNLETDDLENSDLPIVDFDAMTEEEREEFENEAMEEEYRRMIESDIAQGWHPINIGFTVIIHVNHEKPMPYEKKGRDRFKFLSENLSEDEMIDGNEQQKNSR